MYTDRPDRGMSSYKTNIYIATKHVYYAPQHNTSRFITSSFNVSYCLPSIIIIFFFTCQDFCPGEKIFMFFKAKNEKFFDARPTHTERKDIKMICEISYYQVNIYKTCRSYRY